MIRVVHIVLQVNFRQVHVYDESAWRLYQSKVIDVKYVVYKEETKEEKVIE